MQHCDQTLPSPEENLACDEALLEQCERLGTEVLRFWEPEPYFVVVGYANRIATEVNLPFCQQFDIPVLRRSTGGGAVLQGPGCLNYSLVLHIDAWGPLKSINATNGFVLDRHREALTALLPEPADREGQTDLAIRGRKFSGKTPRLAANVAAARFLARHKLPALYRVHEGPSGEKLKTLRRFLGELGLSLRGGDKPQPGDYQLLMGTIGERPDHHVIQTVMLRSLRQAIYSPDNKGHFGLAYEAYTHFTSPIRRYPDLLVHRCIKAVLNGDKLPAKGLAEIGLHCSMTERRADDATRDVDAWLKTYFMQDRIGDEYNGTAGRTAERRPPSTAQHGTLLRSGSLSSVETHSG